MKSYVMNHYIQGHRSRSNLTLSVKVSYIQIYYTLSNLLSGQKKSLIIYGLYRQINGIKNIAVSADIMQGNVFRKSALLIFYNFSVTCFPVSYIVEDLCAYP